MGLTIFHGIVLNIHYIKTESGNIREYYVEYCQSHITLLWIWIMLICTSIFQHTTLIHKLCCNQLVCYNVPNSRVQTTTLVVVVVVHSHLQPQLGQFVFACTQPCVLVVKEWILPQLSLSLSLQSMKWRQTICHL